MKLNRSILSKVKAGASAIALAGALAVPAQADLSAADFELGYAIAMSGGGSNSLGQGLAMGGGGYLGAQLGSRAGASAGVAIGGPLGGIAGFFVGAL